MLLENDLPAAQQIVSVARTLVGGRVCGHGFRLHRPSVSNTSL
jgi:hypothetical protein